MLFNSPIFLIGFLPIFLFLFRVAQGRSARLASIVLLASSLFFYAWWDFRFVALLVASVALNYALGKQLSLSKSRALLALSCALNLTPLLVYKYLPWIGNLTGWLSVQWALPLGISFLTFVQIGFLVTCYRKDIVWRGFLSYANFITFFPHLIAGPILRHNETIRSFDALFDTKPSSLFSEKFSNGLILLILGLSKKVLIADLLCAPVADSFFASPEKASVLDAWTGVLAFACQIYFDFSGYCEMALGMSLMIGMAIPVNFLSPYRSRTIREFWQRWHITLGQWFRDFVYIPLGGNRASEARVCLTILFVFLLTGLWHGAGWNFLFWGVIHGLMMIIYRLWALGQWRLPTWTAQALTLMFVVLAWIPFRAPNTEVMGSAFAALVPAGQWSLDVLFTSSIASTNQPISFALFLTIFVWCAKAQNIHEILAQGTRAKPSLRLASALALLVFTCFLGMGSSTAFMYFEF